MQILAKNQRALEHLKALNKYSILLFILLQFAVVFSSQALQITEKNQTNHRPTDIVVLIHGLLRSSLSMMPLKSFLESQDYTVYYYKYPSTRYSIHEHGLYLSEYIKTLIHDHPGVKIHFVTHSLGGIILRDALSDISKQDMHHIGYLVMLAPPNQGSMEAKLVVKLFPFVSYFIKPLAELSSDKASYVHRVPVPPIPMGIIAGRYDSKVPPEFARLAGQRPPVIIDSSHTFIMNKYQTKQLIIYFLKHGKFPA